MNVRAAGSKECYRYRRQWGSGFNLALHPITLALNDDRLCMVEETVKYG